MNSYRIPESRRYTEKLFVASPLRMNCLPTACYLVNLQARFSKVEHQPSDTHLHRIQTVAESSG